METKVYEIVDSVEALHDALARIRAAQKVFATYTQEQVDKIFLAAASAADSKMADTTRSSAACTKTASPTGARRRMPCA